MTDPIVLRGSSGLDIDATVTHLVASAADAPTGRCARFVREALVAGSVIIVPHPVNAKDYGPFLVSKGFVEVQANGYEPIKGDIVVIQPYKGGSPSGHIAMYDGSNWVSDFVQRDMWSGPGYRTNRPAYGIFRP